MLYLILSVYAQTIIDRMNSDRLEKIDQGISGSSPSTTLSPSTDSREGGNEIVDYRYLEADEKISVDTKNLRDPFKSPQLHIAKKKIKRRAQQSVYGEEVDLSGTPLGSIRVIAIFFGKNRRALIKITERGDNIFMIKEGMKLGVNNNVEIKAILPSGIVAVEKFKNIYNEDEYIETIIPIHEEENR